MPTPKPAHLFAFLLLTSAAQAGTIIADFGADFSAISNPSSGWAYGNSPTVGGTFGANTATASFGPANEVKAWVPLGTS